MIPFVLTPENITIHFHVRVYIKHLWKEMRNNWQFFILGKGWIFRMRDLLLITFIFVMFGCFFCSHITYSTRGDLHEGTKSHPNYAPN